jgi:hypothetical protein
VRNLLGIGLRILSRRVGGDNARNGLSDRLAIDIKVVGRSPSIEAIGYEPSGGNAPPQFALVTQIDTQALSLAGRNSQKLA